MRTDEELLRELETTNNGEGPDPIASYSGAALAKIKAAILERRRVEEVLTEAVREARADGASWSMIGAMLGTSRQSAHERYRHQDRDLVDA